MRPCFSSLYKSSQTCRSGLEESRALHREGGNWERRYLADTYLSEGGFWQYVADFINELTVEFPGSNLSSTRRVFQFCLRSGIGTLK